MVPKPRRCLIETRVSWETLETLVSLVFAAIEGNQQTTVSHRFRPLTGVSDILFQKARRLLIAKQSAARASVQVVGSVLIV